MYLLLVFLPFAGSCLAGLFGRHLKSKPLLISGVILFFIGLVGVILNRKNILKLINDSFTYQQGTYVFQKCNIDFCKLKLLVPISIAMGSFLAFGLHTTIYNPYGMKIQILVFLCSALLNLGLLTFYEMERNLSFFFFLFNSLLLYAYFRFSFNIPCFFCSAFYYFVIFSGYHIFHNTFTKRFFGRTYIILLNSYYQNSQYIRIILWFFLVFIPFLISPPTIVATVCYPTMVFLYLWRYDSLLMFFALILLWCLLLAILNKYSIGLTFLNNCQKYFSRRACLHYIGNAFGIVLQKTLEKTSPWTIVGSIVTFVGVVGIVPWGTKPD